MRCQRGSTLLLVLLVLGVLTAYLAIRTVTDLNSERDRVTTAALALAKSALIGFAVTYSDSHPGQVNGYLPLPDLGSSRNNNFTLNEGVSAANFSGNSTHLSVLGRLAWRTLDLGPLRDGSASCLWYAVSGSHQDAQKSTPMNWDSVGHFELFSTDATPAGTVSTVGDEHQRAVAIVVAPGAALPDQSRANSSVDTVTECSGNYDARNYLDSVSPNALINNIVNSLAGTHGATGSYPLTAPKQIIAGPVWDEGHNPLINDRVLTITPDELFKLIQRRADFKTAIDAMLGDLSVCLNALPPTDARLAASAGNKGVDNILAACAPADPARANFLTNWKNNLLYTKPAALSTVNGTSGCIAVLFFGGARTQRSVAPLSAQLRATAAQTGSAAVFGDPTMYLEAGNTQFPASAAYAGSGYFHAGTASADLVRCIKGLAAGSTQQSFAADFSGFSVAGVGVSPVAQTRSVNIATATGNSGGCFWSPSLVPLAGKTLRTYYDFKFSLSDSFAVNATGADRGNGFTLQLVSAESGVAPDTCGAQAAMGTLAADSIWGGRSIIVETDVHRDAAAPSDAHDPNENHTAILLNGDLDHLQAGASMSAACDGTAAGCRHLPANKFEEAPPALHHQRIEIHSGCDATCSHCSQFPLSPPNDYARVAVWVDCVDCSDVMADLDRLAQRPTLQRCLPSNAALSSAFWGFTGGFRTGSRQQGVTLSELIVRSE